jgi:hypothetical protein
VTYPSRGPRGRLAALTWLLHPVDENDAGAVAASGAPPPWRCDRPHLTARAKTLPNSQPRNRRFPGPRHSASPPRQNRLVLTRLFVQAAVAQAEQLH